MASTYRDADPPPGRATAEEGPYEELSAIAHARGLPHRGAPHLSLDLAGRHVVVSLELNSGSVVGLDLRFFLRGPFPEVVLRRETAVDVDGKERRINREVQTGDPEFDPKVYVESDARDDALLRMLTPPVRRAVLAVLDRGACSVSFDAGGLLVRVPMNDERKRRVLEPEVFDLLLASALPLVDAPRVSADVDDDKRRGAWLPPLAILFTVGALGAMILAAHLWTPVDSSLPLLAIGLAAVVWIALRPLVARVVSGGSTSLRRHRTIMGVLLLGLPFASVATLFWINGALDPGPSFEKTGAIEAITGHDDEDGRTEVTIRWKGGGSTSTWFADRQRTLRPGLSILGRFGRGRLGFEWQVGELAIVLP